MILVLDIETTGLNSASGDEILQFAAISSDEEKLYSGYFKPQRKTTWDDSQIIHSISPDKVANAPSFSDELSIIQEVISHSNLLVAYNAQFDLGFLQHQGVQLTGKPFFCVMKAFACLRGQKTKDSHFRNYSLENCAQYFGYSPQKSHDACADAHTTLFCYNALLESMHVASERGKR